MYVFKKVPENLNNFRLDERFPNATFEDVELSVRLIKNGSKKKEILT